MEQKMRVALFYAHISEYNNYQKLLI